MRTIFFMAFITLLSACIPSGLPAYGLSVTPSNGSQNRLFLAEAPFNQNEVLNTLHSFTKGKTTYIEAINALKSHGSPAVSSDPTTDYEGNEQTLVSCIYGMTDGFRNTLTVNLWFNKDGVLDHYQTSSMQLPAYRLDVTPSNGSQNRLFPAGAPFDKNEVLNTLHSFTKGKTTYIEAINALKSHGSPAVSSNPIPDYESNEQTLVICIYGTTDTLTVNLWFNKDGVLDHYQTSSMQM